VNMMVNSLIKHTPKLLKDREVQEALLDILDIVALKCISFNI